MSIVMFAVIGAMIKAPTWYWVTYVAMSVLKILWGIVKTGIFVSHDEF